MRAMSEFLTFYVLNSIWQVAALALLTWTISRFIARSDALLRHRLWVACLLLAVGLPAISAASVRVPPMHLRRLHFLRILHPHVVNTLTIARPVRSLVAPHARALSYTPAAHWIEPLQLVTLVVFSIYGAGFVAGLLRLIVSLWRTHRLVRTAHEFTLRADLSGRFERAAWQLELRVPEVKTHDCLNVPATVNWPRTQVFVPASFVAAAWPDAWAALSHELVHVKRRDFALNLLYEVVAVPLRFHPALIVIKCQIDTTREMVCDELAAQQTSSRRAYAESLLRLSQGSLSSVTRRGLALGFTSTHPLEDRIMQLLNGSTQTSKSRFITSTVCAGFLACAATGLLFCGLQPVSAHAVQDQSVTSGTGQAVATTPSAAEDAEAAKAAEVAKDSKPLAVAKGKSAHSSKRDGTYEHRWTAADGKPVVVLDKSAQEPGREERARIEKDLSVKVDLSDLKELVNLDDLKVVVDLNTQAALKQLNDPEFKKRIAELSNNAAMKQINDPRFQREIAELSRSETIKQLNDPAFKKQMEQVERQAEALEKSIAASGLAEESAAAALKVVNSPEFKKQIEESVKASDLAFKFLQNYDFHFDFSPRDKKE